ncbi:MAG: hypothetical protein OXC62_08505 [Aestuariivita sp.]|nr:hypothetical protein [Aestuariivita sp.]
MFLGAIRIIVIVLVVLTVVYVCLSLYIHSLRRQKLEAEWEQQVKAEDCESYVQSELEKGKSAIRRKLLFFVYVIPLSAIIIFIYLTNFA